MAAALPSIGEKIDKALQLKEEGNALFKEGKWGGSVTKYHQGMLWIKGLDREGSLPQSGVGEAATDEQKTTIRQLIISAHLNIAQAQIKLGKWDRVEVNCNSALALEKDNVKALFRRGRARAAQGSYYGAEEDFKRVRALEPGNRDAEKELRQLAGHLKEMAEKEKQKFAGMFDRKSNKSSQAGLQAAGGEAPQEAAVVGAGSSSGIDTTAADGGGGD